MCGEACGGKLSAAAVTNMVCREISGRYNCRYSAGTTAAKWRGGEFHLFMFAEANNHVAGWPRNGQRSSIEKRQISLPNEPKAINQLAPKHHISKYRPPSSLFHSHENLKMLHSE